MELPPRSPNIIGCCCGISRHNKSGGDIYNAEGTYCRDNYQQEPCKSCINKWRSFGGTGGHFFPLSGGAVVRISLLAPSLRGRHNTKRSRPAQPSVGLNSENSCTCEVRSIILPRTSVNKPSAQARDPVRY